MTLCYVAVVMLDRDPAKLKFHFTCCLSIFKMAEGNQAEYESLSPKRLPQTNRSPPSAAPQVV